MKLRSLARRVRRGAGRPVGGGIVAAFRGRQPLAQSVRHLLAFCDLQRQRDGRGRTAGAFGRGRRRQFPHRSRPRLRRATAVVGGRDVVEAIFAFETVNGPGYGAVGCCAQPDGAARAWTISTSLDFDSICARARAAAATSHVRDFAGPDWLEQRQASAAYDDRDPDVLIVGGGHAGISVAVEAQAYRAHRAGGRPRWRASATTGGCATAG